MRKPYDRKSNMEKRQFLVLYRSFLMRVIDLELLSADADTARLLGQFAALFAGLSYLFTVWLIFAGGFPKAFLWVMEHFLIATTMVVVSLFSVLCWNSIFLTSAMSWCLLHYRFALLHFFAQNWRP
jgi:hypothetical protein